MPLTLHLNIQYTTTPCHRFHLHIIKKQYGNKAQILFPDTESLIYHVETGEIYKDTVESKELYDLSNFKPTNPYYQPVFVANKVVLGKMKDETAGDPIVEFVGLRPNIYSVQGATSTQMDRGRDLRSTARRAYNGQQRRTSTTSNTSSS